MSRRVRQHYAAMSRARWWARLLALCVVGIGCAPTPVPPPEDPSDTPPMPTVAPTTEPPGPVPTEEPPAPPPPGEGSDCQRASAHALNYYCPLQDPAGGGKWVDVCELAAGHARDLYSCVLRARSCDQIRDCEHQ